MTIYGWDMSHYDSITSDLAVRVSGEGISFVTHKAGGDSNDAELGAWWSAFRSFRDRLLLGAYWVLYPGSPVARADAFIARLDATCPGWRDRPFLLQVDCEKWNNNPSTMPERADIRAFCDRLVAKMPRLRPIVYAPAWAYGNTLIGLGYPLWASAYVGGPPAGFKGMYPGDGSSRWAAYSGQTPAILQYTSTADVGGQSTSDANAYRGTLADLIALAAPGWETTMTIAPEDLVAIKQAVWGFDVNPSAAGYTAAGALFDAAQRAGSLANGQVPALADAVAHLAATDPAALAAAVVAALPTGQVDITPAELQAAIVGALRELAAPAQS